MSTTSPQPGASDADSHKTFSCVVCRQRKVRCDRNWPCQNCTRAEIDCEYVAPVRGKRKRTKTPREGLHAKMRRYEDLLKTRGVSVDDDNGTVKVVSDTASQNGLSGTDGMAESPVSLPVRTPREAAELPMGFRTSFTKTPRPQPELVNKQGNSRYYENSTLWSSIGEDFAHPDEFAPDTDADGDGEPEIELFLGSGASTRGFVGRLQDHHPPLPILHSLKEVFVDRVDPLLKIMHIPTFWTAILQAGEKQSNTPSHIEAAIFCFYFATISVLDEEECGKLFGEKKKTMFAKYRTISRHALGKAGLLSTTNPMTLRAFALFMMGLRSHLRHDSQYILCGIALRLAQKMGLHRDGKHLGLSCFETEMRRRLWWYITHLDFRTADLLGTRPSLDIYIGDVGLPLNVEDEDLYPEMASFPEERKAITPMVMCLVRCDLSKVLEYLSGGSSHEGVSWGKIGAESSLTMEEKDAFIDHMEDTFERKYIRYCDPTRPLDVLVSCMVRAAVCNMRLYAHNPRRFADAGGPVSEAERQMAFTNASKLLEYASLVVENKGLRKYEWRINTTYLWDKILYVLIEARHRRLGYEVDRLWELIGRVFSHYPDAFGEASAAAVYTALSKWTLEVWDGYIDAKRAEQMLLPEEPAYIQAMRRRQRERDEAVAANGGEKAMSEAHEVLEKAQGGTSAEVLDASSGFSGFSNLESFEMNLDEWMNWEHLVSEQTGFYVGSF